MQRPGYLSRWRRELYIPDNSFGIFNDLQRLPEQLRRAKVPRCRSSGARYGERICRFYRNKLDLIF
jgi:hypothetical protein